MAFIDPSQISKRFAEVKGITFNKAATVQRVAFVEIANTVIDKTPVKTGNAAANWQSGNTGFQDGLVEFSGQPSSARTLAKAEVKTVVGQHSPGQDLTLNNNVDYINSLNSGTSAQAPSGMTDTVVNEFAAIVQRSTGTV